SPVSGRRMPRLRVWPDDCDADVSAGGVMDDLAEQEARVAELRLSRGAEHPETLAAMLDLAERLWAAGRLGAARALEEQVVAARLKLVGEKHADTLKAMGKLATTLGAQGDLARARQ